MDVFIYVFILVIFALEIGISNFAQKAIQAINEKQNAEEEARTKAAETIEEQEYPEEEREPELSIEEISAKANRMLNENINKRRKVKLQKIEAERLRVQELKELAEAKEDNKIH